MATGKVPVVDEYPGRTIPDSQRSPRGLGWEYRRRGLKRKSCPFGPGEKRDEFFYGFDNFICSDSAVNRAMLRPAPALDDLP